MFILTITGKEDEGAYSVIDEDGDKILYIFQEEDDAIRFALLLEESGYPDIHAIEIEDDIILKTCELYGYLYTIITPNDIVIPPETNDNFQKDSLA
jgi:hypothetical protein